MDNSFNEFNKLCQQWNKKPIDYLVNYPYLTMLGRTAGLSDDEIRKVNKKIIDDKELLMKIYDNA